MKSEIRGLFVLGGLALAVVQATAATGDVRVEIRGVTRERLERNFNRLEEEKYRPDKVFLTDEESGGWPGDTEGRTILGLVLDAQATGRKPKHLDAILARLPDKLNAHGYMGAVLPAGRVDEQQISGNGWMLRALCEYALWTGDAAARERARTLARGLFLPTRGMFAKYPIDAAKRRKNVGEAAGSRLDEVDGWILSSDVGCFAIGLDGLVQAWRLTGDDELKPVIDEMIARFLEMDLVAIRAQTHATLTGLRALLRYSEAGGCDYLSEVERRFALYRAYGMTEWFENVNWFKRYDTWTEPCAIVDSYLLSVQLWERTRKPEYLELADEIWWNGLLPSQRANGGFGTHNVPGRAAGTTVRKDLIDEAHWCCTMRGAEGLACGARAVAFAEGDAVTLAQFRSARVEAELPAGRLVFEEETDYPSGDGVTLRIVEAPRAEIEFRFFAPSYLVPLSPAVVRRAFAPGDTVTFAFRQRIRDAAPACPENAAPGWRKLMKGPLVVTPGFTHEMPRETNEAPLETPYAELARTFADPFGKVQTGCYWYWLSGHVSAEGVRRDLAAMKRAGIDRAYIGDVGEGGNSPGAVRTFSDAWWKALGVAFEAASEYGVELGLFNSPGWSQSGGPWISHDKAMRRLAASATRVGSGTERIVLPRPAVRDGKDGEYADVAVVAYPDPGTDGEVVIAAAEGAALTMPEKGPLVVELSSEKPVRVQSAVLEPGAGTLAAHVTVEAEADGAFAAVGAFDFSRVNGALNVGFDPMAPAVGAFAPVTARRFRVTVAPKGGSGAAFRRIALCGAAKVGSVAEKTLAKMHETPLPMWREYQWPRAADEAPGSALDAAKAVVLTDRLRADGTLDWTPPEGSWIVYRFGMVPTRTTNAAAVPEATGYEVDKMNAAHVEEHVKSYLDRILARAPAAHRAAVTTAVLDSYEVGGQNFTDGFAERFKSAFGYDPTPYLAAFAGDAVASRETSDRFLWDVRRFVADEVAYEYVGGLRRACGARGLATWLECYGHWGFPGEFLQYGGQSDGIAGEFWSEGDLGDIENRAASSCGHIYGKRLVWSESNTCGGRPFARGPMDLKERTDRFFCEGVNATLLHLYVHQDDERAPGTIAWFGNEFNRKNTWFGHFPLFSGYLKRCNWMLRQGLDVADLAYFIGEDAPKMTGVTDPAVPAGRTFDYINGEVLRETAAVDARGRIVLPHGTAYEALVLPKLETMRPEMLAAVERLVKAGALVVGPRPVRSPSLAGQPAADARVKELADRLWGDVDGEKVRSRPYGKGVIAWNLPLEEALAQRGSRPDCLVTDGIRWCHRTSEGAEIYFLANGSRAVKSRVKASFRVTGRPAELWDAATGARNSVSAVQKDGRTEIILNFASLESKFIVFPASEAVAESVGTVPGSLGTVPVETVEVKGPWTVTFASDALHRGPKESVMMAALGDLSKSEEPSVRHYSGLIVYRATFELDGVPSRAVLDLGSVSLTARVRVNGHEVGGVCFAPYSLEISKYVKTGANAVEIEVCNSWLNRLIGDASLPEAERPTWVSLPACGPNDRLPPSGLLGPVAVRTMRQD